MHRASKTVGAFVIIAFLCAVAVFVIEEIRFEEKSAKFEEYVTEQDAININTATKEEIEKLEGIGEKMAERIIEFREEKHEFSDVYELTLIRGIGEEMIKRNKGRIKVR